jgi:hypothetical protein
VRRRGRDKFADVGPAIRQALDRANAVNLPDAGRRTFNAALHITGGSGRLWDDVYVADVRALTGPTEDSLVHEVTVRVWLKKLAELRIFGWEPKRGTDARGRGFPSRLTLPSAEQVERERMEPDQTEPRGRSVSSEGKPSEGSEIRVEQDHLGLKEPSGPQVSVDAAHAREPDGEDELLDEFWAETAAPKRDKGAYWEPAR